MPEEEGGSRGKHGFPRGREPTASCGRHEDGDADAPAHGIAGGGAGCVNRPTVILTVEPCGA